MMPMSGSKTFYLRSDNRCLDAVGVGGGRVRHSLIFRIFLELSFFLEQF